MRKQSRTFDARLVKSETLSAKQFLALKPAERSAIASVEIEPVRLGSKRFGGLIVYYKNPIYRVG